MTTLQANDLDLLARHQASIVSSLDRRLAVARQANDTRLIQLLEQEQQQVAEAESSHSTGSGFAEGVKRWWSEWMAAIAHRNDPQVWPISQGDGDCWWYAFNPRTGESVFAESESELREWLEASYWR